MMKYTFIVDHRNFDVFSMAKVRTLVHFLPFSRNTMDYVCLFGQETLLQTPVRTTAVLFITAKRALGYTITIPSHGETDRGVFLTPSHNSFVCKPFRCTSSSTWGAPRKRSLMSWVVVMPKLLLVWHRLFQKKKIKNFQKKFFSKNSKKSVSYQKNNFPHLIHPGNQK